MRWMKIDLTFEKLQGFFKQKFIHLIYNYQKHEKSKKFVKSRSIINHLTVSLQEPSALSSKPK